MIHIDFLIIFIHHYQSNFFSSIWSRSSQFSNQFGKERTVTGFENSKLKLCFINQTAPTIFTNNEIKAKDGKPLLVAICENTTNSNAIIKTGLLSSALVEFVVLDGEFGFNRRREKNNSWSRDDFNKSIVSERVGKRPLIVGNDKIIRLNNGFVEFNGLSFSDNSSWTKTKKFKLGVKVLDEEILTRFPRIDEAVSEPLRVMDQRGEGMPLSVSLSLMQSFLSVKISYSDRFWDLFYIFIYILVPPIAIYISFRSL